MPRETTFSIQRLMLFLNKERIGELVLRRVGMYLSLKLSLRTNRISPKSRWNLIAFSWRHVNLSFMKWFNWSDSSVWIITRVQSDSTSLPSCKNGIALISHLWQKACLFGSVQVYWSQVITCFVFCTLTIGRSDETRRLTVVTNTEVGYLTSHVFERNFSPTSIRKLPWWEFTLEQSLKARNDSWPGTNYSLLLIQRIFIGARSFSFAPANAGNRSQRIGSQ